MIMARIGHQAGMLAITLALILSGCQIRATPRPVDPGESPAAGRAEEPPAPGQDEQAAPAESRPVTLAFAGDVHFEGRLSALPTRRDTTLGPMSAALRSADVAVVNLESALTTGGSRAAKELEDPTRRYWFRSPPSALALLERSGVDAVAMANNHAADYGAAGLRDTLRTARGAPVAVIGVGRGPAEAYRPYRTSVDGVDIAVLAADASPLESNAAIWDVQPGRFGIATARDDTRLVAAVRAAAADSDVVAVYLHWGVEGRGCPTAGQRTLAQSLSAAGADVIVGAHAHLPLGAGMLNDTYVSYGLGNFLWYNGSQPDTGVLRVQVVDGRVVRDDWVPGAIKPTGGRPRPLTGSAGAQAVKEWRALRGCTGLAPGPSEAATAERPSPEAGAGEPAPGGAEYRLPAYAASIQSLSDAVRRRMTGSSHDPARCPVRLDDLRLLTLRHVGFDGRAQTGQLIVHRRHARDVVKVFGDLYQARFPIRRLQLVDAYGGNDDRSMAADNSSGYNCRTVAGQSSFSDHAYGAAIDLNPVENPYVTSSGVLPPAGRPFVDVDRKPKAAGGKGVIVADDVVVRAFARIGWKWGGVWNEADFQHFHAP
jgi:poly-gamma-glutamate capsule biosynthesis protein CapA/YwtB (metallophosphatase superfamily)